MDTGTPTLAIRSPRARLALALRSVFWAGFIAFCLWGVLGYAWDRLEQLVAVGHRLRIPAVMLAPMLIGMAATAHLLSRASGWAGRWVWPPLMVFCCALTLRLLILLVMGVGTHQVSDYRLAMETARHAPPIYAKYYQFFSHWLMQVRFLRMVRLIGALPLSGLAVNAVLSALSAALVYWIVLVSRLPARMALLAGLLFACWPAHLLYAVVLTPEFAHIFWGLLAVLLVLLAARAQDRGWIQTAMLVYAVAGVVVSLAGFFRSVEKIGLIAVAIVCLLRARTGDADRSVGLDLADHADLADHPADHADHPADLAADHADHADHPANPSQRPRRRWPSADRVARSKATAALVLLAFYALTNTMVFVGFDAYNGARVSRDPTMYFLYTGLNSFSSGEWHPDASAVTTDALERTGFDYARTRRIVRDALLADIAQHRHLTPAFFARKAITAWRGEDYLRLVRDTVGDQAAIDKGRWFDTLESLAQLYYMAMVLCAAVGALAALIARRGGLALFSALMVFGFALLMLLSEVQSRYKCVVYPYLAILAAYGIDSALRLGARLGRRGHASIK